MSEAADGFGAMATAGLIGREIERGRGGMAGHDEHGGVCANCGAARIGPYCHACGQTGHVHRNLSALLHDIAHGVFHFEGKIWHTLPLLALKPGELTRRYVAGERAKFVSPMALFLFSVFLMFAVVSGFGDGHKSDRAHLRATALTKGGKLDDARTELATLKSVRAALPAVARADMDKEVAKSEAKVAVLTKAQEKMAQQPGPEGEKARADIIVGNVHTGWQIIDQTVNHISQNPELALYKIKTYAYKYSWALIPISVPFIWLLFAFRRDVGFYDHAIFSIYSLSFMSLGVVALTLLSMIGVATGPLSLAVMILAPIHMYRQLKGAYRLGRWGAGWRTFALLIITAITSSLFFSFLVWMGGS